MKNIYKLITIIVFFSFNSQAQPTNLIWQKNYGGPGSDIPRAIAATPDGGYVMVGVTSSTTGDITNPQGQADIWVVKVNSIGTIEWQKCLGTSLTDQGYTVKYFNSAIWIGGYTVTQGAEEAWVVKLDDSGTLLQQKTWGGNSNENIQDLVPTPDGGYIFVGYTSSTNGDPIAPIASQASLDIWLVKVNGSGSIQWQKRLGGNGSDIGSKVQMTSDGGYIIIGSHTQTTPIDPTNNGGTDAWVIKFDASGNQQWEKKFGGSGSDDGYGIKQMADGGYILTGSISSAIAGHYGAGDVYVVRIDASGNLVWQRALGTSSNEQGREIILASDGSVYVAGRTVVGGTTDGWLVKLSSSGNVIWQQNFGGTGADELSAIIKNASGNIVIAGSTNSTFGTITNKGGADFWLFEISEKPLILAQNIPTAICPGQKLDINFYQNVTLNSGNIYTVQLSNASGSFASPTTIGTLTATTPSKIEATIPTNISGSGYRIRVVSSNPVLLSSDNGVDITIGGVDCCRSPMQWQLSLGSSGSDGAYKTIQTTDGGYLTLGWVTSNGGDVSGFKGGVYDAWVVKLDAQRNILWKKTYGGVGNDFFYSAVEVGDGFVFAGSSTSTSGDVTSNKGNYDTWAVKTDFLGNIIWKQSLGSSGADEFFNVVAVTDGYVFVGECSVNDGDVAGSQTRQGQVDIWVVKLNLTGNTVIWKKCYGGSSNERGRGISKTLDNGFFISGTTSSTNGDVIGYRGGTADMWGLKLNFNGNLVWSKCVGGSGNDEGNGIATAPDGGLIIAGESNSNDGDFLGYNNGGYEIPIVKLNPLQGDIVWRNMFGGVGTDDKGFAVIITPDQGILLGGRTASTDSKIVNPKGSTDALIVKFNAFGVAQWQKTLGGSSSETLYSLCLTNDNGYLIGCSSSSSDKNVGLNQGDSDYWLIKIAPEIQTSITATSQVVCNGGSTTLTLIGCTGSILWNTGATNTNITVSPVTNTTYSATCQANSCTINSTYTVTNSTEKPIKVWDKRFGGTDRDPLGVVKQTADGGFLLGSNSISGIGGDKTLASFGDYDFWMIKTDILGNKTWEQRYGGSGQDVPKSIIPTADGNYIFGGYTNSPAGSGNITPGASGGADYWVFKVAPNSATPIWQVRLGGTSNDALLSTIPISSGGYLLVGQSISAAYAPGGKTQGTKGGTDYWVVKIDANGNKLWDKSIGGSLEDLYNSAIETTDGGFILAGSTNSPKNNDITVDPRGGYDYWAVKIDANGNKQWDKRYGGAGDDNLKKIIATDDGGYLLLGHSNSNIFGEKNQNSRGLFDYWVVKIDRLGNFVWDKTFGGGDNEELIDGINTLNGNYTLAGRSKSGISGEKTENNIGNYDFWMVEIDSQGNKIWDKSFGGTGEEDVTSIIGVSDGSFMVGGFSDSNQSGDKSQDSRGGFDNWILKFAEGIPPTVFANRTTLCNGQSSTIKATNCFGTIAWSTGAIGDSLVVSPLVTTSYTASCITTGQVGCPSAPIIITVCQPGSQSTFGYTSGNFGPTDGGAAVYGIPIILPSGSSGVRPELAIGYNSQGGNGLLGVGWSLDGLHAINRASKTRAQDEAFDVSRNSAIGISLNKEDRFALDGSRLTLAPNFIEQNEILNGNYGRKGTEYITEQNQFTKVIIPDTLSNGSPKYFIAYTKDGLIMEFGNSLDSRIDANDVNVTPLTWLVNKISDRNGNYIKYTYQKDVSGVKGTTFPYGKINSYPIRIEYTANDAAPFSAYNRVEFEYTPRADKQWNFMKGVYVGGGDKLISKIRVFGNNIEVRRYELSYTTSKFTANSLLYQVRECADTMCHEPTTFNWLNEDKLQRDATYKEYNSSVGPFPADAYTDANKIRLSGDWDGDGTTDLFVVDKNTGVYNYYLNRYPTSIPNGYNNFAEFPKTIFSLPITVNFRTADFNSDGKTDILWWSTQSGDAYIIYSGYYGGSLHFSVKFASSFIPSNGSNSPNLYNQFFQGRDIEIVDWNHDGITDIVSILKTNKYYSTGSDIWLQTQPPTYSTNPNIGEVVMNRQVISVPHPSGSQDFNRWQIADFNNDGLSDVCMLDTATSNISIYKMLSVKTANKVFDADSAKYRIQDPTYSVSFENIPKRFNWSPAQNRFIPYDGQITNFYGRPFFAMDANGDGLPDIAVKMSETSYQFQLSTGDFGFFEDLHLINSAQIPYGEDITTDLIDFNNDGNIDLLTYNRSGLVSSSVRLSGFDKPKLSFSNPLDNSLLSDPNVSFFLGNYSKNNFNELLYYKVNGTTLTNKVFNNTLGKSDLIGTINEGSGQEIQITYKTLKDPTVYARSGIAFKYPLFEFTAPISVLASVRSKDGIGGYVYTDYQYEGAFSHSAGRGFRGFTKVITKDRQRNTFNIKYFNIDANKWWLAGQPFKTEMRKDDPVNGQLLSLYEATFEAIPYTISTSFAAQPSYMKARSYYSYGKVSTSRTYDLNSTNQISITTSRVTQNEYGNSTKVVVDHGDNVKDSTVSQYTDNVGTWLLGRLTRSTAYRFSINKPTSVRTVAFEYNVTTGQLTKEITDPDSSIQIKRETIYSHDLAGNITQTEVKAWNGTQIESRISQIQFDNQKRLKLSTTNAIGQQGFATYNTATGSIATTTDINGLVETFEHDAFQRITKVISPTGEESIERYYRANSAWNSPANSKFLIYKKQANAPAVIEHYDILGRMIRADKVNFSGNTVSYVITFNNKGEKTNETGPGLNAIYQYDLMSRMIHKTDFGEDNTYEYIGNQTTVTDIKGRKRIFEKNNQGQLLNSRWQSSNGSIANHRLDYEYDGRNNPTKVVGNTNGFEVKNYYDARGYKIRMEDPAMGTYRYEYNGFGEMLKQTDPKGNIVNAEYDKLGRVTKRTEPEGITTYLYDIGNKAKGKVTSITGFGGIVYAYTYDNYGRVATETKTINSSNYVTAYQYTLDNKIDLITYPSGLVVKHEYNAQDYLYIVRRVSDGKVMWRAKTANDVDNILTEDVYEKGTGQNSVLRHSYTYSSDLAHITQFQTSLPTDVGTPRIQRSLTYDNRYFITGLSETVYAGIGQVMRTGTTNYTYDDIDQLKAITPNISFPQSGQTENTAVNMTYDIYGNILNKSDVGNYVYDQNPQGGLRYLTKIDLVNPAVCIPSFKITTDYTSFNKVKKIANDSSYALIFYGPDHARVMQQLFVNNKLSKTKIYVNGLYEIEITGSRVRESSYIQGGSGVVAVETKVASTRTIQIWVKDYANNLVAVVDTNGNVLEHLRYDVWGRRLNANTPGAVADSASHLSDRGFTKHEHLDLFQLINMNGRIYDPIIGRFTSPDPYIQDALDLQAYNRYAYVQNNPIMFTDPSGYIKLKSIGRSVSRAVSRTVNVVAKKAAKVIEYSAYPQLKSLYLGARVVAKVLDSKVMPEIIRDNWRPVVTTAATVVVGTITSPLGPTASGAASGFTSSFLGSAFNGGSYSDAVAAGTKGAIYGAMFAYLAGGVGDLAGKSGTFQHVATKTVGHAVVSGSMAEVQGGNFWDGAKVGAVSGATGDLVMGVGGNDFGSKVLRTSIAATIGGTTSAMNGGKFSNGAISAAMTHMYNHEGHNDRTYNDRTYKDTDEALGALGNVNTVTQGIGSASKNINKAFDKVGSGISGLKIINHAANGNWNAVVDEIIGLIPYDPLSPTPLSPDMDKPNYSKPYDFQKRLPAEISDLMKQR